MTASQAQRIVDKSLDTGASNARIQAAQQSAVRKSMTLAEMLEWYGSDIEMQMDRPSPTAFATALRAIKTYQEQL